MASLNEAREQARVARVASQLRELQKVAFFYVSDTGELPPECRVHNVGACDTAAEDPFYTNPGVAGWNGPYFRLFDFTHPWGGHIGFDTDGVNDESDSNPRFILDDDKPGNDTGDNSGFIPVDVLEQIDALLDDGDLNTGDVRGHGYGGTALGEIYIIVNI